MNTTKVDQLTGTWVNQLNSRLYLEEDPSGSLHGSYVSGVGDLAGTPYPVLGFCEVGGPDGALTLGFVVRWTEDHSVTSWSGHYDPATGEMSMTWLLAYPAGPEPLRAWKSTLVGHDTFRRRHA